VCEGGVTGGKRKVPSRTCGPREIFSVAARSTFFLGGILVVGEGYGVGCKEGVRWDLIISENAVVGAKIWAR
jgi:hypothetical protein